MSPAVPEVLLWWVALPEGTAHPPTVTGLRAARRGRSARTRSALLQALTQWAGHPDVALTADPQGRPLATVAGAPVGVSVSRSGGLGVICLCPTGAVGVDVEQVDPALDVLAVARRFFGAEEHADLCRRRGEDRRRRFLELWTWKEALAKAVGVGLQHPLVSAPPPDAAPGHGLSVEGRGEPTDPWEPSAAALCRPGHASTAWPRPDVVLSVVTAGLGPRLRPQNTLAALSGGGDIRAPRPTELPKAGVR